MYGLNTTFIQYRGGSRNSWKKLSGTGMPPENFPDFTLYDAIYSIPKDLKCMLSFRNLTNSQYMKQLRIKQFIRSLAVIVVVE